MTIPTLSPISVSVNTTTNNTKPFDLDKVKNDKTEQDRLISWVSGEYTKIRQARFRIEQQWYLNLAFYLGRQNVVNQMMQTPLMGQTGRLVTPPAPPWRARPVINKIRRYVRKEHSKLTAQKPTAYVVPATADDDDIFAAQAGEQIWESLYGTKNIQDVLSKAIWWALWCGSGFIKNWWDENQIDTISNLKGDICVEPVTPFHLLVPDFIEEEIENQSYVMHISTKDLDWVKLHFPETYSGKQIAPNVNGQNAILDTAFINLINANNLQVNSVLIEELWVKPNMHRLFPDGAVITIAGNEIVQTYPEFPYKHNKYPFIKLDHIANAKFYSDSVIVDLIPLQREYNRTHGQIVEAKNRMAKPQLAAMQGSVDPKKISSEPGQVILYKAGFQPPTPIPLQNLPQYVVEQLQMIAADMDDIVGQHDVSSGQVPPGVTAATAISYLQEADDSILQASIRSVEQGIEKLGYEVLNLAAQYWDVPRTVKVTGLEGSFDVLQFSQEDLKDNTDLHVQAGSALPLSKAGRAAQIMDLMKMGWIPPQQGLELMELGGAAKLFEEIQVDVRQAQRENVRMQRTDPQQLQLQQMLEEATEMQSPGQSMLPGMPPDDESAEGAMGAPLVVPVNTWDDHPTHIAIHNRFRKSQAFEILDPAIRELFEEHVSMHQMAMQQQQQQQMMQQMQMQMPPGQQEMPGPEQGAPEGGPMQNGPGEAMEPPEGPNG